MLPPSVGLVGVQEWVSHRPEGFENVSADVCCYLGCFYVMCVACKERILREYRREDFRFRSIWCCGGEKRRRLCQARGGREVGGRGGGAASHGMAGDDMVDRLLVSSSTCSKKRFLLPPGDATLKRMIGRFDVKQLSTLFFLDVSSCGVPNAYQKHLIGTKKKPRKGHSREPSTPSPTVAAVSIAAVSTATVSIAASRKAASSIAAIRNNDIVAKNVATQNHA